MYVCMYVCMYVLMHIIISPGVLGVALLDMTWRGVLGGAHHMAHTQSAVSLSLLSEHRTLYDARAIMLLSRLLCFTLLLRLTCLTGIDR